MLIACEKLSFNNQGYLVTNLGARPYVYHVSMNKSIKVLEPRTDKYSEQGNDVTGKSRVCFADTVHGCITALCLPGYMVRFREINNGMAHIRKARKDERTYSFYLYRANTTDFNRDKVTVSDMTTKDNPLTNVFDRYLTGEIGYYGDIPVTNLGEIKVTMMGESEHLKQKYKYVPYTLPLYTTHTSSFFIGAFLDFEISSDSEDIPIEFLKADREELITRYHLYKNNILTNLKHNTRLIEQYLKSDNILWTR
jgi:hypothetical protein